MASSQAQKDKFEQAFQEIIEASSTGIAMKWTGQYHWVDLPGNTPSQPKVDAFVKLLPGELKDRYVSLLNNFKHNRL
jgi:hypothetical protein